jgi:hypothetical protein
LRPAVSKEVYHNRGIIYLEYSLTTFTTVRYDCTIETQRGSHLKKGIVSVACQGVCFMRICCVPSRQQNAYELQRDMGIHNVQQFESACIVSLYVTIICTHTELLNDIDNAQLLYHVIV